MMPIPEALRFEGTGKSAPGGHRREWFPASGRIDPATIFASVLLPGAVLSHQGVHFTGAQCEVARSAERYGRRISLLMFSTRRRFETYRSG